MSYETNDIHLPEGSFITRLAQYRTEVVFSPRLSWTTLIQYDNQSEVLGLNSRLHWFPEPGREAFPARAGPSGPPHATFGRGYRRVGGAIPVPGPTRTGSGFVCGCPTTDSTSSGRASASMERPTFS